MRCRHCDKRIWVIHEEHWKPGRWMHEAGHVKSARCPFNGQDAGHEPRLDRKSLEHWLDDRIMIERRRMRAVAV